MVDRGYVRITHPLPMHPVQLIQNVWIIASGRAHPSIFGVVGEVTLIKRTPPQAVKSPPVPPKTLPRRAYQSLPKAPPTPTAVPLGYTQVHKKGEPFYRWKMKISVPTTGTYNLKVTGYDRNLTPFSDTLADMQLDGGYGLSAVTWPGIDEDISAYKDEFAPYGTLDTNDSLTTIWLNDGAGQNRVDALSISNYISEGCWTAELGSVPHVQCPTNCYTLNGSFLYSTFTAVTGVQQSTP